MTEMLLEWVITSIFLILTVLALRAAFGRRVSALLRYALWAVVLARLLVPVQLFTSPLAGTRFFSESRTGHTVVDWPVTSDTHITAGPDDGPSLSLPDKTVTNFPAAPQAPDVPSWPDAPEAPAAPDLSKAPAWLGWLWLGGSIALAMVLAASNLRFALRLRRSRVPLEEVDCPLPVYAAAGLPSPCLFGLARPAVYVTPEAAADPAMLRHVLAHEYTHFRHGDHLLSFLRCAALAVHWWNPLVWLAVTLSRRDGELACDEGALKRLGNGERLGYGNTLLALVTARPGPGDLLCFATTMAGEKRSLKERVSRIACAPKRWLWAAVAVVLVTALACACAFGSAEEPETADGPDAELTDSADEFTPVYTIATGDGSGAVLVEGLGGAHVEWCGPDIFSPSGGGWLYFTDPVFFCPSLTGKQVMGNALWTDETRTAVGVVMNVNDDRTASLDAAVGFYIHFNVELDSGTVFERDFNSPIEGETLELTDREMADMARALARLLTGAEAYYYQNHTEETAGLDSERQTDLDRDGVPETVRITEFGGGAGQRLEIREGGELIFAENGYNSHAGWNAVFLCTLDGKDYLLRYNPYMSQGMAGYSYQLFTLENGVETAIRENYVEFDINFGSPIHVGFDPEAIAAFLDEVNGLLAHSVQLINTDDDLLRTFQKEGRLYDGRWQLNPSVSMLENLREYQASMEPNYPSVLLGQSQFMLFQDESGYFLSMDDVPALICADDDPQVKITSFTVVDMDGDGMDEVLVWVCGKYGDNSGYLLLRQENGAVYGTIFNAHNNWSNRWFIDLKTDGTFECQDVLDRWYSISKLSFTARGGVGISGLTVTRNDPDYDLESFMTIQKEVAREKDWQAALEAQNGKPGAAWYEFNTENIVGVFMNR